MDRASQEAAAQNQVLKASAQAAGAAPADRAHTSHPLNRLVAQRRCLVMGILNTTPDSFSDGGQLVEPQAAVKHAQRMVTEGADLLDVGAESTRPYDGAVSVSAEEEWERLAPILPDVIALGVPVSVDTMKSSVAAKALALGASIVNDVGIAARWRHGEGYCRSCRCHCAHA